jgi:hypothetical protein
MNWHRIRRAASTRLHATGRQLAAVEAIRRDLAWMRAQQEQQQAATQRLIELLDRANRLLVDIRRINEGTQTQLAAAVMAEVDGFFSGHVMGFGQTLEYLIDTRCSFARFGDGELRLITQPDYDVKLQRGSPELSAALRRVLTEPQPGLLLGFPFPYRTPHWQKVWSGVWSGIRDLLRRDVPWGCSHVSRPIAFQRLGDRAIELWRRLWDSRDVVIITGEGSRFSLHPALFDGVKSAEFIYSRPQDAFTDLDRVRASATSPRWNGCGPFLISLGPAGTVLAAELARQGRWAIDIGHLSASFEFVADGAAAPEVRAAVTLPKQATDGPVGAPR